MTQLTKQQAIEFLGDDLEFKVLRYASPFSVVSGIPRILAMQKIKESTSMRICDPTGSGEDGLEISIDGWGVCLVSKLQYLRPKG